MRLRGHHIVAYLLGVGAYELYTRKVKKGGQV